jgi:hypothetical protein
MKESQPAYREGWPVVRGLSRIAASQYIGVSPSLFDQMVADGRMPSPKRINSRTVWDRVKLDLAFDSLPDGGGENPWDNMGGAQ